MLGCNLCRSWHLDLNTVVFKHNSALFTKRSQIVRITHVTEAKFNHQKSHDDVNAWSEFLTLYAKTLRRILYYEYGYLFFGQIR